MVGEFSTATQATGWIQGVSAQGGEGEFADGREVACGVPLADATVVFAESHVKHPVHGFDAPVGACGVSELFDRLYPGTDNKVAPIDARLALDLLHGLDHAPGAKLLPILAHRRVQPRHVSDKDGPAGFDPAMILFDRGAFLYLDVAEVKRGGGIEELNNRRRQIFLIVLDRQNIISALSDNFLDDLGLASPGRPSSQCSP